jgi:hypothetical protein
MKHLKEQDSRTLFFNRVFGSEKSCPPQFEDISAQILKKCTGLPLAIITIASLLASHEVTSLNEWERIKNALGAKSATQPTLEEMRGILNLSYIHLPLHLRPCLLYLGMYPEDREIMKNDLVRQWIAEGFVCSSRGVDLEDVAKSYFNELVNRSLIQPAYTFYGEVISCRVHDMMLDLILSKSTEDNFISVTYNHEDLARLHNCEYKVRRLSLQSSVGDASSETLATSMSQVRSYAQFGGSKYAPPLSQFKYVRVFLFEFPYEWDMTVDITAIGRLFVLRYLKVNAPSSKLLLPTEIQGLAHLETVDLNCLSMPIIPSDITRLANLFYLRLPHGTVLPKGIENLKSVRTLHCWRIAKSSLKDVKGLSELTNLKELQLGGFGQGFTVEQVDALVSSIGMLHDLRYMFLNCQIECDGYSGQLDSLPDPPLRLEVLELETWTFRRVPKWFGDLSCLRFLRLRVLHLSSDEVRVLGELPSLVEARFSVLDVSQDKVLVGSGSFPVLEQVRFWSKGDVSAYLSFEAGAMPKLQSLTLAFPWKEWRGATPVGMECLPCLQNITVDIKVWFKDTDAQSSKNWQDVRADVESAFKSALSVHPGHPSLRVF